MFLRKVLLFIVLGLLALTRTIDAICNLCSKINYAACINETAFNICLDGVNKSEYIGLCPDNHVCTAQQGICKPRDEFKPDCGVCDICLGDFACISQTEFEYCDTKPNGITGKCPVGQYCSLMNLLTNSNICIESSMGEPTCYAVNNTPTPAPGPEYTKICTGKSNGNYENISDSTCKTYVYCEELNGVMHAILNNCGSGYFSTAERKCIVQKPSYCTCGIKSLNRRRMKLI